MDKKTILITGGAGFIGSNFIRYILNKYPEYHIINLDKLTYAGNPENLTDIEDNNRYSFIRGDICDKETVKKAMKNCDWVVHFAAESHVDRSIEEAGDFIKTNVYGTYILLECAKELSIKRFIHISTDEVYGSIEQGKFTEDHILCPSSPYSSSKAASDLLALSYNTTFKLPVIVTRSSNNFGHYQYPEKVIPLFITNAFNNKNLPLYGDGKNVRNWIYVEDNCSGIDTVLHKGSPGEIYNIGGEIEESNINLTKTILNVMEKPETLIQYVTDRLGHDRRYALDSKKIKALGWNPKFEFKNALKNTIDWYTNNKEWWLKLKS